MKSGFQLENLNRFHLPAPLPLCISIHRLCSGFVNISSIHFTLGPRAHFMLMSRGLLGPRSGWPVSSGSGYLTETEAKIKSFANVACGSNYSKISDI